MKKNDWASRFGVARRASDRKLLAALERDIANQERAARVERDDKEAREAIARAFGRPTH